MLELMLAGGKRRWSFGPERETITLGRAPENDLVLDNQHVSALHGRIGRQLRGYFFQDLGSTNGSALERSGRRTVLGGAATLLQAGDRLLLGAASEPVVLEVVACSSEEAAPEQEPPATVVATLPLADSEELGRRLESSGRTLAPFLELVDRLAGVDDRGEAVRLLAEFLERQLRQPAVVQLLQRPAGGGELLRLAGDNDSFASRLPERLGGDLLVEEAGPSGVFRGWLRLGDSAAGELVLGLDWGKRRPVAGDLDTVALAGALLRIRLEQLGLVERLEQARASLASKHRYLLRRAAERAGDELVGHSPALEQLRATITRVAVSDVAVLITGPSGAGKELVARQIHRQSLRHGEILAAVNCGALVEGLLEVELFGCRRGAYTGAVRDREGLFQVADGGTLFLDEVGEMSPALQVKLLRVLESGQVTPVGDTRPRRVDVRLLAATNRNLDELVRQGRFRQDLFFRLNVFPLRVPALAERREDIPLLAEHFLDTYCRRHGVALDGFSPAALQLLCRRDYPGNVRQLANEIQRAVLLATGAARVEPLHLAREGESEPAVAGLAAAGEGEGLTLKEQLTRVERTLVEQALSECGNNRTRTARRLGLSRQALGLKLKKLGLASAGKADEESEGGQEAGNC
ncbi:MAG: hypothetical protein DRI34_09365 [Deltaproteobacteria bacterium]|nr:MAG: hypothetical protein DRI34_09365 [Deltaproteobacteria bacterium]